MSTKCVLEQDPGMSTECGRPEVWENRQVTLTKLKGKRKNIHLGLSQRVITNFQPLNHEDKRWNL